MIPVRDLDSPELSVFRLTAERQLLHYFEPNGGLFLAESPLVALRALEAGCRPYRALIEQKETYGPEEEAVLARLSGVPVYAAPQDRMRTLTGYPMTRGLICAMHRPDGADASALIRHSSRIAVLEEIMNPTNLGAVFRSAAAMGIDAVLLSPGCCDPLQRRCLRVSMGNVFSVPWAAFSGAWPEDAFSLLEKEGFLTAALAIGGDPLLLGDPALREAGKIALFVGSEGPGLSDEVIGRCAVSVRIPMVPGVDSLNAAAAAAVAFWELGNREKRV